MINELDFKAIKKLLIDLKKFGVEELNYSGGEPLLKKDFDKVLLLGYELGFKQIVSTNATLIDRYWCELFRRTNTSVCISLEGDKEVDNQIRGQGHFERAINAILLFKKYGIRPHVAVTLAPWNMHRLSALCKLVRELGVTMGLQLLVPGGVVFPRRKPQKREKCFLTPFILGGMLEVTKCIRLYRELFDSSDEYYEALIKTALGLRRRPCVVAYRRITVSPDGYIYPCGLWPKPVGHIDEGVDRVWFSKEFNAARLKMRFCMKCFLGCYEPDNITYEKFLSRAFREISKFLKSLMSK